MDYNTRLALVSFGSGIMLYLLFKDSRFFGADKNSNKTNVKRIPVPAPVANPKDLAKNKNGYNAFIALKAYINAYNNLESDKALEELNREFAKELKVRVYKRSSDGNFLVADLFGNTILINKN
jgi:hypothetical protein